jgi:hypothetical protein
MAESNSPKRVSFEDPPSSASDEDRNPVEVGRRHALYLHPVPHHDVQLS